MFVSCDPLSGNYLDVYPDYAQNCMKKLKNGNSLFLGPDCFNAEILLKDGLYCQTTPAVAHVNKSSGFRSVTFFNANEVIVYEDAHHNWSFKENVFSQKSLTSNCLRYPATSSIWQWSLKVGCDITLIRENDWVAYSKEDSDTIEDGFQSATSTVSINVGMKQYNIHFCNDSTNNKSVYALQVDAQNSTRTRMCRRAMRHATFFTSPTEAETCALCTEDFKDTPHIPWVQTLCGHHFHAVCLERMKMSNHLKCPLCRASIDHVSRLF